MKRVIKGMVIILIAFISVLIINTGVSADTGPKPFVEIKVDGNCDNLYMTLLSKFETNGPNSVNIVRDEFFSEEEKIIDKEFASYKDKDGLYYLHVFGDLEDNKFKWGYFPPSEFKILIYDSLNDNFITDDNIYETYAFGSYYTVKLNEQSFNVERSYNYTKEVLSFVIRLIVCIIIEVGIALLFRIYKQELLVILGANIVTQLALNIILSLYVYNNGAQLLFYIVYIMLEIIIVLIELFIYYWGINKVGEKYNYKPKSLLLLSLYTLSANIVSFGCGFLIYYLMK